LHAVQFVPEQDGECREGWAVGDDGVVWHSIDGGRNWERQPTGVRASLRSLHFLTPLNGWVAGREELPNGAGSVGVLLYTGDGGITWRRVTFNAMPGLNVVRFVDEKYGFVAGDGADPYPSGVFETGDGGRKWRPVEGPRCPSWVAGCFLMKAGGKGGEFPAGSLFGSWGRMGGVNRVSVTANELEGLETRTIRGVHVNGESGFAVGDGGVVLKGTCGGNEWAAASGIKLGEALASSWDLHAIHGSGSHYWAVGRPGSLVLHTPDAGNSWEVQRTGHPLPLHGIYFANDKTGWAVGDLGTVLGTTDGGKTWTVRRRGGQRAAALFVNARSTGLPADTVALLGGQDGYLTAALRVTAPDPKTAAVGRVTEATRFMTAHRQAGGAAAESLWQFPVPSAVARGGREELLKAWEKDHGDKVAEDLLRQLVLAVRMWRPDVIITDNLDAKATGFAGDALVAEAMREAFDRAADPKQFPEQLTEMGLEAWKASKLYGRWEDRKSCHIALDLTAPSAPLQSSARDFAAGPAGVLAEAAVAVPPDRCFGLLASHMDGAALHKSLMQGLDLPEDGPARRKLPVCVELDQEIKKAIQARATLRALSEGPPNPLADPNQLLAQIGTMTKDMPPDLGAAAINGAAAQYARMGQWDLARETYMLLADRYPTHPLAIDAYRWLIRHNSSSEARRRRELGQYLVLSVRQDGLVNPDGHTVKLPPKEGDDKAPPREMKLPKTESHEERADFSLLSSKDQVRKMYQSCLDMESRLIAFGPIAANDPTIQFPLQAARRNLGDVETAQQWYKQFAEHQPEGPWRSAALAELWLARRGGPPPKPVATCRFADAKPYLDGKLDDPCWQAGQPLKLTDARPASKDKGSGVADERYQTDVRLAYDNEYLYVAVHCTHPEGKQVPPVKDRKRDADLRAFDRVSLMLDLDRDYATCYHLQVDQRGCVCDDCWGDKSWDPRWFVAVRSEATSWTVEAAIPLHALTCDPIRPGQAWAFNAVRVVPGVGVQSFSQPAEVPEESLRLEGMGLLMFVQEKQQADATPRLMPPARP
jgi:photosystem II stability/assembly factor-like uncharacterized protein